MHLINISFISPISALDADPLDQSEAKRLDVARVLKETRALLAFGKDRASS